MDASIDASCPYRLLFESAPAASFLLDPDGRVIEANPRALELFALSDVEVVGRSLCDVLGLDARAAEAGRESVRRLLAGEPGARRPLDVPRPGEAPLRASLAMSAVRGARGEVVAVHATVLEASAWQATEERLRESEERYRTLFQENLSGNFVSTPEGEVITCNPAFARMFGYASPEEAVGSDAGRLFPNPAERERLLERLRREGRVHLVELTLQDVVGRPVHVMGNVVARFDGAGRLSHVLSYLLDVSERREAERRLAESEERFRLLVDNAAEAFYLADPEGRILDVNRQALHDTGYTREELLGMKVWDLSIELTPEAHARLHAENHTGEPTTLSGTHRRRDGSTFPVQVRGRVFHSGGRMLSLALARDVTQAREAEEEIERLGREKRYLQEEMERQERFHDLVGRSAPMRDVFRSIERVAPSDATVLICGETGTGKELVAHAVHRASPRRERVLVTVNCAALSPGLVESELFGHEKGAFTGAIERRIGRFEAADGGSIFLDEIGDLPADLQAKLLRVLQEGRFERVGGSRTIEVDARVIAATNRNIEEGVRDGRFRADLYYRLHVFPIAVPALRERLEDLPLLVTYFVNRYAERLGKRIDRVPEEAFDAMRRYDWPGNVRELENVVERAVILSRTRSLDLEDWVARERARGHEGGSHPAAHTLEEAQRRHIREVLERTGGQVGGRGGAAEILGLKESTLRSRMKKLGIARPS